MRLFKLSLFFFISLIAYSQENPIVMSFTPETYGAESQNWGITQTDNEFMYFANNSGLLEFNGSSWKLYPVPDNQINNSIVRSVKAVGDKIFSGSYMDFGIWSRNKYGNLDYESIPHKLGILIQEEEQFWNIEVVDNLILFQSLSRIYIIDLQKSLVTIIESDDEISKIFNVEGVIYFTKKNKGVYKILNGDTILVSNSTKIMSSKIVGISKIDNKLVFITNNKGVLFLEKNKLIDWRPNSTIDLNRIVIYSFLKLKDSSLVLGTISNGIIHLNVDGSLKYNIDFEKGLNNNTILSLFQDKKDNLWLGLDIGVSHVNLSSRFGTYNDSSGQIGTVYASIIYDNHLYLGTNQGLFTKQKDFDGPFNFIAGTSGQVWKLKMIDNLLFCGHNKGTLIIENQRIKTRIFDANGSWDFKKIRNTNLILQGNYKGLHVLEKSSDKWSYSHKIEGFDISSRFFQIFNNIVYVNHELRGFFKLELSNDMKTLKNYSLIDSIEKGSGSNFIKFLDEYLYSSSNGFYRLEKASMKFQKSNSLSEIFKDYSPTTTLLDINSSENMKWCFSGNNILIVSPGSLSDKPVIEQIPIKYSNFRNVVMGFENLTKIDQNEFILGSSNGYFVLRNGNPKLDNIYEVNINSILSSVKNETKQALDLTSSPSLHYKNNNLYFNFSIPKYGDVVDTKYSYTLEGWSQGWSNWSSDTSQIFENLPYGDYIFKVKGKVGNTLTLNEASFPLAINRPWYLSISAIIVYIIFLFLGSISIHNIYKQYYNRKEKALLIKSQKEIALSELESNQKLIELKNEKLEIDIEGKNRELAISTMSLIKKNEFLSTIKDALQAESHSREISEVINIIDKNLNNTDDWKLFKQAFDNADKGFLKLVKNKHQNLTPNDLKLCAYLRLNLSSKEIAPLLNISFRSVEVKRYRLRKKLNLPPKSGLTSYILSL